MSRTGRSLAAAALSWPRKTVGLTAPHAPIRRTRRLKGPNMVNQLMRERWARTFSEFDEKEAFARLLYSSCGGFVDWDLLPEEWQTKADYRSKAADLIELLDHFRER